MIKYYITLFFFSITLYAAQIDTCFTPAENCTDFIVHNIAEAKNTIYMQAYSFTSTPIADALIAAHNRGVTVSVILDKSQAGKSRYVRTKYLLKNGIALWVDYKPAIAHNKVIIIDHEMVLTGSFNYTSSAQKRNAENVIAVKDTAIVDKYYKNWLSRFKQSKSL